MKFYVNMIFIHCLSIPQIAIYPHDDYYYAFPAQMIGYFPLKFLKLVLQLYTTY